MNTVLKWVGGKQGVMAQLKLALPKGTRLIEPFCGSGAVMMNTAYSNYVLADINADVINTYDTIRNAAESVIAALTELYETCRTREHYDAIRKEFNARTADPVRMAAMFIYMNRHGYRGLCRYNKRKGEFNVPWGDYRKPYLPEKEIRYMADRLENADLLCAGFEETLKLAGEGDVVYCDPPYVNPGKFTGYHSSGFSEAQQRALVDILNTLPEKGVHVVASSHDAENIRQMYAGFTVQGFSAPRSVYNGTGEGKKAKEIIAIRQAVFSGKTAA